MKPSLEAFKLLMDGSKVLAQIERNGVRIATKRLERTIASTEQKIREIEQELKSDPIFTMWRKEFGAGAKLSSNQQLGHILYKKLGIKCTHFTDKKAPSVSEKALQDVDHPFVKKLFEMKHLEKTVGTFLKGIQRETINGICHPFYNLHTTVTFRSSSDSVNWQNLPRRDPELSRLVRRCIIARKGNYLGELDFKGAEVCVASAVCGDKNLQNYVRDKTRDMHRDCAMELYCLEKDQVSKAIRNAAKQYWVFAQFYGDYYIHCAKNLWEVVDREGLKLQDGAPLRKHLRRQGLREMGDCNPEKDTRPGTFEAHVKKMEGIFWNERFPEYRDWKRRWWNDYQENGAFVMPSGFLVSMGKEGPLTKNEATNSPVQGPSFHCLLWTLIRLGKWLTKNKMKSLLVGQIHDSILFEAPPDEIQDVLNEAYRIIRVDLPKHFKWLTVDMDIEAEIADIGGDWYSKKPWARNKGGVWMAEAA